MSGTLVYQYRLESRTYCMALLIASRGPSALAELLVYSETIFNRNYKTSICTHTVKAWEQERRWPGGPGVWTPSHG